MKGAKMETMQRGQKLGVALGVALIEDVPPDVTDSQLLDFFTTIHDVESVSVMNIRSSVPATRNCWINVHNPLQTLTQLKGLAISGKRLQVRLMGYLYPINKPLVSEV